MGVNGKQKGLGRGLDAIFDIEISNKISSKRASVNEIDIDKITAAANQPRTNFDEEALQELSDSILSLGLVQPITVRDMGGDRYTIISGERRYRASKMAGLTSIPAYVRSVDDGTMLEMALVENIQRQDLNPVEIAVSLQRLIDEFSITQEALSIRVGKKRSTIANYLRLLKLPVEVQLAVQGDVITMGHAKALVNIESKNKQIALLKKIIKNSLSVRQTEELVKAMTEVKEDKKIIDEEYPEVYVKLVDYLERYFTQDIRIKRGKNGDGKIIIGFKDDSQVGDIIKSFERIDK